MKIFNSESEARSSLNEKPKIYLNSLCPYSSSGMLCGTWCALCYVSKQDEKTSPYIILGCKGTDKKLYV